MSRPRIILVREWDAQVSGSGCCGRLGGRHDELGGAASFAHSRREMEAMGAVYRCLRGAYDDDKIDLNIVDPRNTLWLVPALVRDAWRRGWPYATLWRQIRRGIAYNAIVVDGRTLFSGRVPSPSEALAAVTAELQRGYPHAG